MNRLQKKCFVFSIGLHGLLAVIVLASAAFRDRPEETDAPILSMIPANILDRAGVGGGEPVPANHAPPAQPAPQPQIQPAAPQAVQPEPVRRVERQKPKEAVEEVHPAVAVDNPSPKVHHQHEIQPTFTPASRTANHLKTEAVETSSQTSAHSETRRLAAIENSLNNLASGVQTSAAAKTVVDVPGVGGGGEVFAGYRDIVKSYYYRAWIAPENGARNTAAPEARIEVARDGSIISAKLVTPSGEATLDKSVLRALEAVPKLPPFPSSARDEKRTFLIQFSLDLKEASG